MHIALVQLHPLMGDVDASIQRADTLASDVIRAGVRLALLPEMALTGYCLGKHADVAPLCDAVSHSDIGSNISTLNNAKSLTWAATLARNAHCFVQIGLPRREPATNINDYDQRHLLFNSVALINPDGVLVALHDKKHLYYTDEPWATEGAQWSVINNNPLHIAGDASGSTPTTVGFAICMDINPYRFEAPWDSYECASFYATKNIDLLSCSMAWLAAPPASAEDAISLPNDHIADLGVDKLPNTDTIRYWVERMQPLVKLSKTRTRPTYMVVCNRVGREIGNVFCGTSCVLRFKDGTISLIDTLGASHQGVLIVDLNWDV